MHRENDMRLGGGQRRARARRRRCRRSRSTRDVRHDHIIMGVRARRGYRYTAIVHAHPDVGRISAFDPRPAHASILCIFQLIHVRACVRVYSIKLDSLIALHLLTCTSHRFASHAAHPAQINIYYYNMCVCVCGFHRRHARQT